MWGKITAKTKTTELFRVSRRVKQENILLDVVKWVAQLNNYKHHNRNSKRDFPLLISST